MNTLLLVGAGLLVITFAYALLTVGHRAKDLPPGPPTVPLLGNLVQIPLKGAHFMFTQWAQKYGEIYTLKIGSATACVLTSPRLVKQLLDKKSAIYASRPVSYVANLISGGDHILLMQYGDQWRATRKLLHGCLREGVVEKEYGALQEAEANQMIYDYLVNPDDHMKHPKRFSNSVTMSIVWGIRSPTSEEVHMERLMEIWSRVMETGATPPVDIFPFLHYIPQSLFTNWRSRATHVQREMNGLYADFLTDLRTRRAASGSRGSLMGQVLDQVESEKPPPGLETSNHALWFLGGTLTEGGSDTSASILTAFVQAMVANPAIQKKAQAQIDSVIGPDRSPNWSDYASLPYIAQIVKETMRWRPVTPLAFPHALAQDDWVDGFFLPKGTTIIVNAWGMQHDPTRFKDPEKFDPDHFDGVTKLAPELANGPWEERDHYGYGAGRRLCPGIHLAERNLWLGMAKLLWGYSILPGLDKEGKEVAVDTSAETGYCEGFLVCAYDFPARFEVRGKAREATIRRETEAAKSVFAKYE
ncbi:hypothetical protein B0A48_18075 [Cryoendolithus antarcticus]|uniref:Cytochrome P450 n=1 Tax=Cryoendolithus antarcticus TaxID=1507870 RepID=A0A1V8SB86_9PEZI|nr:hypothetical protein B0A48_18075 [Cryoendolithus antarcticus]